MTEKDELLRRLYNVEKRKIQVVKEKKAMAADHRDQLKDLEDEISEIMEALDNSGIGEAPDPVDLDEGI